MSEKQRQDNEQTLHLGTAVRKAPGVWAEAESRFSGSASEAEPPPPMPHTKLLSTQPFLSFVTQFPYVALWS